MKKITILMISIIFNSFLFAQQWTARFNGTANGMDEIKAMVLDKDANVYVTGYSFTPSHLQDYVTIKYNSNGVKQWQARYDGPGNGSDVPTAIFIDRNGFVYVTGASDQLAGLYANLDATTIKYDQQGNIVWVARFDGDIKKDDGGNALKVDDAGNVYIAGYTSAINSGYTRHDYLTVKYNAAGVQQWVATYNGPANDNDDAIALSLDRQNNVVVTGSSIAATGASAMSDYYTIKYSNSGVQQWATRYEGPSHRSDVPQGMAIDMSGNIYITGYSRGIDLDIATIKYSSTGVEQWVARYNGAANSSDIGYAIELDDEGYIYVTGSDQTTIYNSDYRTIKYSPAGTIVWTAKYDGPKHVNDEAYALAVDRAHNVYVTGYSPGVKWEWDIATIKYSSTGAQQWVKRFNASGDSADVGNAIKVDTLGNVYVAGASTGSHSQFDFQTIKYSASGNRFGGENENEFVQPKSDKQIFSLQNSPNPFVQNTVISYKVPATGLVTLKIYNSSGNIISIPVNEIKQAGSYQINFNARTYHLVTGIYFYELNTNNKVESGKMVLIN